MDIEKTDEQPAELADQTIQCVECDVEFVFTAGEQGFYMRKGFTEKPKRCAGCRAKRKQQREELENRKRNFGGR